MVIVDDAARGQRRAHCRRNNLIVQGYGFIQILWSMGNNDSGIDHRPPFEPV
ncbi:hypothetical protein D3C71_2190450 [compost metagenome]